MLSIFSSIYHAFFSPDPLRELGRAGLLQGQNQALNRYLLSNHQDKYGLALALRALNDSGLLTHVNAQVNYSILTNHDHLAWVNQALKNLSIIAPTMYRRGVLRSHQNLADLSLNLSVAHDLGLLTHDANFDALSAHEDPRGLFIIMSGVFRLYMRDSNAELFREDNLQNTFNEIMSVISRQNVIIALQRIGHQMFSAELCSEILGIVARERANPEGAREQIIARLNLIQPAPLPHPRQLQVSRAHPLPPQFQQTRHRQAPRQPLVIDADAHTASVDASASESAGKLKLHYGRALNLERAFDEMRLWLDSSKPSDGDLTPHYIVKQCFERLRSDGLVASYQDPRSKVKVKELLALVWTAFKNVDNRLVGSQDDAKKQLLEGLYEIETGQAGLNLCPEGTFNKLIEKGCGLHPDMVIIYQDKSLATMKFPVIVREAAIRFLTSGISNHECLMHLQAIRAPANADSVEPIWPYIVNDVNRAMTEEFPTFADLISTGIDVQLSIKNLVDIENGISTMRYLPH